MSPGQKRQVESTQNLAAHGIRKVLEYLLISDFTVVELKSQLSLQLARERVVKRVHFRVLMENRESLSVLTRLFVTLDNEQRNGTNEPTVQDNSDRTDGE